MKNIIFILILILFQVLFFNIQQNKTSPFYNKKKEPTTWGINDYVKKNQDDIVKEYEYFIGDTLFEIDIWTDDFSTFSDGKALGAFYIPNQIYINNQEKYVDYELRRLSKFKQTFLPYTERTVKAVIFHELTHAYVYQMIYLMKKNGEKVSTEYNNIRIYPNIHLKFGATFIEEGISEYVVYYLNESTPIGDIYIPKNEKELLSENYYINNVYHYSVLFLKDFLDEYGIKTGIKILLNNSPPTYKEILNPTLFFNRLTILDSQK